MNNKIINFKESLIRIKKKKKQTPVQVELPFEENEPFTGVDIDTNESGTYIGEYKEGLRHGKGTWTHPDGRKFVGEFKNGDISKGTLTYQNGDQFTGQWINGEQIGFAEYINGHGDILRGYKKDYILIGNATILFSNGDKYVGELDDESFLTGHGEYTFANGEKYIGQLIKGIWHGNGSYHYDDGELYVGEYKEGLRHGKGTLTFPDGRKFVGEFLHDDVHYAHLYHNDELIVSGLWVDDGVFVDEPDIPF